MEFIANTPLPSSGGTPSALDFRSLDSLKKGLQGGAGAPAAAQREVARQFEAMFIQLLLRQARATAAQMPTLFDSQSVRMAQSLSDEQSALVLADPGLGLADALMAQMRGGAALAGRRLADTVGAAIRGAPEHIRRFVDRMASAARAAAAESGVPARLILSQAALESGWGQREIVRPDGSSSHNLFGIKAGAGWRGDVVNVMTREFSAAGLQRIEQPFRAYRSYAESFADYARLIGRSDRYREVRAAPSAEEAARRIQAAGYATDPAYADKLIAIMGYFQGH